jgi:hypothetical protein
MPTTRSRKCRRICAYLLVAAALGASATALVHPGRQASAATTDQASPVLVIERDGLRYEYHVPTGGEFLFDPVADPRGLTNLARDHETTLALCRTDLAKLQGVSDLSELGAEYAEMNRRLRSLGYF